MKIIYCLIVFVLIIKEENLMIYEVYFCVYNFENKNIEE